MYQGLHGLDILVHDRPARGSRNHRALKLAGFCSRICGYIEITSCVMLDAYVIQRSAGCGVRVVLPVLEFSKILNFSNWILALDVN